MDYPIMTEEAIFSSPFVNPFILFGIRVMFGCYYIAACIYVGYRYSSNRVPIINTLSYLHMLILTLYFVYVVTYSLYRWSTVQRVRGSAFESLTCTELMLLGKPWKWNVAFAYVLWVIFEVICPCTFLVTLAYWIFIEGSTSYGSMSMHAINTISVCVEMVLSRYVVCFKHIVVVLLLGGAYLIHMYMYRYNHGVFIYKVFDYDKHRSNIVYWPAAIVVVAALYLLVKLVTHAKRIYIPHYCATAEQCEAAEQCKAHPNIVEAGVVEMAEPTQMTHTEVTDTVNNREIDMG